MLESDLIRQQRGLQPELPDVASDVASGVASGGDSVVVYDLWREALAKGEESEDWQESEVLNGIRDYNRDDCDSTLELCQWLREQHTGEFVPEHVEAPDTPELTDIIKNRHALRDRLLARAEAASLDEPARTRLATLAGVLEFHRREEKNAWWRFFERMDPANTMLADDPACIADCRRTTCEPFKPTPRARNLAYEFEFDIGQERKGITKGVTLKGADLVDDRNPTGTVIFDESDLENGTIVVQCKHESPPLVSLVPSEIVRVDPIPTAIDAVVGSIETGATVRSALLNFLERNPPNITGHAGGSIIHSEATRLEDTIQAVRNLDHSCLVIQGPPGAGKSYTGARIIASLVSEGKRVGVASNSHSAINNLLIGAARFCQQEGIDASFYCTKNTSDELGLLGIEVSTNRNLADQLVDGCAIGTTAWGFSRDDMADALDVLVVDEAGQVAVANLVAISRSASNLVLMGDQRQLGQPTQGTHPAESGLSALDYRLGDTAAVDPEHGVFLGTTYRMHPDVNAIVSRYVYVDQLVNAEVTSTRTFMAKDIAASVHQKLLNRAKEVDRPFNEVLQYFAMERLLYRLSQSKFANQFILKGALLFRIWGAEDSRATRDIDFYPMPITL
jgi:hypothetical protein